MVDKWEPIPEDSLAGVTGDKLVFLPDRHWHIIYGVARGITEFAKDRRTILRKDSVEAAGDVEDGSLDFVFIDADHSYEGALADIRAWVPKVREGGIVCGHDFDVPEYPMWGVRRAMKDYGMDRAIIGKNYTWCVPKSWIAK